MLREKMLEDLKLRSRSEITQRAYLGCARRFAEYFDGRPPATLGEREIREFLLHVVEERGASPATHHQYVAALKFLYSVTLRQPQAVAHIPYPSVPKRLPDIPTGSEVERLLSCICRPQGEWLFPSNASPTRPVNERSVSEALSQAVKAARLKRRVTPHLLRHSFATHLLELGTDLRLIQMLLGHSSFRSTRRYVRLQGAYLRRIKSPIDVIGKPEGQILR